MAGHILPVIILSCSSSKPISHCEVVISCLKFYDPKLNDYVKNNLYWPDTKIWYKDSMVIEQIPGLYMNTDTNGIETRWVKTEYYTFIDLRTKSFYDYSSFSDTAGLIKKYIQADSTPVSGGWNFYAQRDWPGQLTPVSLSDTLIDNIVYKRIQVIKEPDSTQQNKKIWIGYLNCDRKNTLFMFDKSLSKTTGCPIVRFDEQPLPEFVFRPVSAQIEFISDTLSNDELKVFNAWEKNAKNNPVSKK